uniref:UPAR/Ly6 domain-containing protein n=1 Tax=Amphilophus citrinellus TaxID=61819 RepID=A0A3Q0RMP7_AMPCI
MKLLVLALSVALLFAAGESVTDSPLYKHNLCCCATLSEALNCHHCVPKKAGGTCELSVETCKPNKNGCAAANFLRAPRELLMNAYIDIKCCSEDLCNTL